MLPSSLFWLRASIISEEAFMPSIACMPPDICSTRAAGSASPMSLGAMKPMPTLTSTPVRSIQRRNWVRATAAIPMILPNISSVARTELMSTSTTLLDFSSITADITIPPNIVIKRKIMMPSTIESMELTPASETFSSPDSESIV